MKSLKKLLISSIILIVIGFLGLATVSILGVSSLRLANYGASRNYMFGHKGFCKYIKEITRISHALNISIDSYYRACDDFLNFDIDLSGHKEATEIFVRAILVSTTSYGKLDPPENYKTAHNLFGTSLEHFNKSAEYLTQYIKASGDDMNTYLEKAIPEVEQAATYLNQVNEKIKNVK